MRQVSQGGAVVLTRSISARRSAGKDLKTSIIQITGRMHLRPRRGQGASAKTKCVVEVKYDKAGGLVTSFLAKIGYNTLNVSALRW